MDAKQLGALDDSLAPRPPSTPSNDKEPVRPWRPLTDEHRAKIAAARRRQVRPQRIGGHVASWVLDPDFDEWES